MIDATPRYLVGVDGGGTGCRAAIADLTGRLLGQGAAGPANATTDLAQTIVNVRVALDNHGVSTNDGDWQLSLIGLTLLFFSIFYFCSRSDLRTLR